MNEKIFSTGISRTLRIDPVLDGSSDYYLVDNGKIVGRMAGNNIRFVNIETGKDFNP